MGAVGTGKTHLAAAIAMKACEQGRHTRFFTAASLANILQDKNQKGQLASFLKMLKKMELVVVDEVGFVPLHKDVRHRSLVRFRSGLRLLRKAESNHYHKS